MQSSYYSTFLLTILLAIGLGFFLRAASKDRTTIVNIESPLPTIDVLNGISNWLEERGWQRQGGDADRQVLRFIGSVSYSPLLAIFLSILCSLGGGSLGLGICQIYDDTRWWPLLLILIGPLAGLFYSSRASRLESLEMRLLSKENENKCQLRIKAHRDELISLDRDLSKELQLANDVSLDSSPI